MMNKTVGQSKKKVLDFLCSCASIKHQKQLKTYQK